MARYSCARNLNICKQKYGMINLWRGKFWSRAKPLLILNFLRDSSSPSHPTISHTPPIVKQAH